MSNKATFELDPSVHIGLNRGRNRRTHVITKNMLPKLIHPSEYKCILPPIMGMEEDNRIMTSALMSFKGKYDMGKPYLGVLKEDSTVALRPQTQEEAMQRARIQKDINTTRDQAQKDFTARRNRFLAERTEWAWAERDRLLRDHREAQDMELKKVRERNIQPKKPTAQPKCQPPPSVLRQFRDRLDLLKERSMSFESQKRKECMEDFQWKMRQEVQSGIHWPGQQSGGKQRGLFPPIGLKGGRILNNNNV
ncbi:uncharacterized protein LOC142095359 [Mixophyes fleayi]|uniref:uncharacterized protein LOC142095359 n=1 Tax=Mixophyes fleayi TaxID=3061075 RepID=UPI003F4DC601